MRTAIASLSLAFLSTAFLSNLAQGQSTDTDRVPFDLELVTDGLKNPCSLVVRPGGSRSGPDLLLAEQGAGRVLGLATNDEKLEPVVVLQGFNLSQGPSPSSIVFRSRNRLLTALPGTADDKAVVCEYDLDDDLLPMESKDRRVILTYENADPVSFPAIDFDHGGVMLCTGPQEWLLRGRIQEGTPAKLRQFVKTVDSSGIGNPTALVFSEKGYLVVAESGSNESETSKLVFYHPTNQLASPLMVLDSGLVKIRDLKYSPKTGNLFATGLFPEKPDRNGLYRLQAEFDPKNGKQFCKAVLVASLEDPTSLAFANDGSIFVTNGEPGQLLKGPLGL